MDFTPPRILLINNILRRFRFFAIVYFLHLIKSEDNMAACVMRGRLFY